MTQENYLFSDLDLLLSKNNVTEGKLLQLPVLLDDESKTSAIKTPLNNEPTRSPITPTNILTIVLNDRPKNENQLSFHGIFSRNRERAKKLLLDIALLDVYDFNLVWTIPLKKKLTSGQQPFWTLNGKNLPLKKPLNNFQRISVPLRSISSF